ncbi:fructosamine kinase family protein, partial [Bacillus velezensis]
KPQVGLAVYNQLMPQTLYTKFQHLYTRLADIFPNEKPALLHGDLWHGNVLIGKDGYASLIDPAVYYGNREAEIAFTYLFGGFEPAFYDAYTQTTP